MSDLFDFLERSGGLHDAVLKALHWDAVACRIELEFDDIFANFEGFPEYPGEVTGRICLEGVSEVVIEFSDAERPSVTDSGRVGDRENTVEFVFWPDGRIQVKFERAKWPTLPVQVE